MATNVLLVSEDYIKTNSAMFDNYFGKWLLPAIKNAQNIQLQSVLGTCLYEKLLDLVKTGDIRLETNIQYKDLLDDYVRDFLMYAVLKESVPIANVKIANLGTTVNKDEYMVNLTQGEADILQKGFEDKADYYCKRMQQYLLNYYDSFPELAECECNCSYTVKPNLTSSTSSGIWLGGIMFKKY